MIDEALMARSLRRALDAIYRPSPGLPALMRAALVSAPSPRRRYGPALAGALALVLGLAAVGTVVWSRAALSHPREAATAPPFTAPGLQTDPAAQVAWVLGGVDAVGVDPSGHQVGRINGAFNPYLTQRSPDGKTLVLINGANVQLYDAANGRLRATVARPAASVGDDAFSPDSRYLALLTTGAPEHVELVDLAAGTLTGDLALAGTSDRYHGFIAFHESALFPELYVISGVATAPELTVLGYSEHHLRLVTTANVAMPTCGDPAPLTSHMLASDARTLALFCHESGRLSFVDTQRFTATYIDTRQPNPFWFWPVYSPDGTRLYLIDTFSHAVTVVDLETRKVGAPVKVSVAPSLAQRLAGLFVTDAEAGGIADTQPISPDGSLLYMPGASGLVVLDTQSMAPVRVLLAGRNVTDVWVSGDGGHLYAIVDGHLAILSDSGPTLEPGVGAGGFVAAAHG